MTKMADWNLPILILQLLTVVGVVYLLFVKAYIKERAKILATKQDLEEVTKKVESIKIDLQFQNQINSTIYNDLRDAIINLYADFNSWFNFVSKVGINAMFLQLEDIDRTEKEMEEYYTKFRVQQKRASLFIEEPELLAKYKEIELRMIDIQSHIENYFTELEELLEERREYDIKKKKSAEDDEKINAIEHLILKAWKVSDKKTIQMENAVSDQLLEIADLSKRILRENYKKYLLTNNS
jgi:hypothetical protein